MGHAILPNYVLIKNNKLIIKMIKKTLLLLLQLLLLLKQKTNFVALVCERNIPTERPPLVSEVSANNNIIRIQLHYYLFAY
jgi:hypothetical protein